MSIHIARNIVYNSHAYSEHEVARARAILDSKAEWGERLDKVAKQLAEDM